MSAAARLFNLVSDTVERADRTAFKNRFIQHVAERLDGKEGLPYHAWVEALFVAQREVQRTALADSVGDVVDRVLGEDRSGLRG